MTQRLWRQKYRQLGQWVLTQMTSPLLSGGVFLHLLFSEMRQFLTHPVSCMEKRSKHSAVNS